MIQLIPSPRESLRFGLRVGRACIDTFDVHELISALQHEKIDALDELRRHGFVPIVADTLVRYEIDLRGRSAVDDRQDVSLRAATSTDATLLESMARKIFAGYVSHYHANPLFPADRILDGYAEWAAAHVRLRTEGDGAWIVERDGEVVGFSCYHIDAKNAVAIGVLNGILPNARGNGNYRAMLRAMLEHFSDNGVVRFSIATQAHNVAVQHTWTTEGLSLRDVSATVHIDLRHGTSSYPGIDARPPDLSN
jgi:GNAT superfamily N-acetyltransferase